MPPVHNHYVPAYYLRGFTNPVTGNIFMYFKRTTKVIQSSVQSVANQLHYWSDETEKYLAGQVEGPANPVLDKITCQQPITNEDKWILSRYIITMLKRVPEGRARMLARAPTIMQKTLDQLKTRLTAEREAIPSEAERVAKILGQIDDLPQEYFDKIPKEIWENIVSSEMMPRVVRLVHQMQWVFFTAGRDRGFVTSDNPIVYTRANGLRPPEGELVFPISQQVVLWASWTNKLNAGYYPAQKWLIDEVNYWTVASATDYVFYSGHKN